MDSNCSAHNCVGIFSHCSLNSDNPHWFKRHNSPANPVPSTNPQPQVTRLQDLQRSKIVGYEELQKGRLLWSEEVQGSDPQYTPCTAAKSVFCSWGIHLLLKLVPYRQYVWKYSYTSWEGWVFLLVEGVCMNASADMTVQATAAGTA